MFSEGGLDGWYVVINLLYMLCICIKHIANYHSLGE